MKEHDTFPGNVYAVTCSVGCTLTDDNGMKETVEAGKQFRFMAQTAKVYTSEPATVTRGNFKFAPAEMLGLLGGGASASALPEGYLAAEFIENTKNYNIALPFAVDTSVDTLKIETLSSSTATSSTRCEGTKVETSVVRMGQNGSNNAMLCEAGGLWVTGGSYAEGFYRWTLEIDKLNLRGSVDGVEVINKTMTVQPAFTVYMLFTAEGFDSATWTTKKKNWKAWRNGQLEYDLIPALGPDGYPCFFNKLTGEAFSDAWRVTTAGLSLAQARKLGELPKKSAWLGISLPVGYESDAEVMSALEAARAKGWNLGVRTYTPDAATSTASTFGMRRIWVRRTLDEHGMYVDADGKRWHVDWCAAMYNHDNSTPDMHGYEMYRSVDSAVAYWEMEPWVDPEQEEILTES